MRPEFVRLEKPPGLQVRDPIENAQFELYTSRAAEPRQADTDQFVFPVDHAVTITTASIEIPRLVDIFLRSGDGRLVGESANKQRVEYPDDWYALSTDIGPMKIQLVVDAGLAIRRSENSTYVEFAEPTPVAIGVRSLHESPAGTVTVGPGVEDAMKGVSMLGSALKTKSPERSFPTLRGHPPLIERGEAFHVPDGIGKPETDVEIRIPREYGDLYRVGPLAYYLGADVVPGDERLLVLDGDEHPLDTERGFEDEVTALLQHVFFLDCVTRTEGFYPVNLYERNAVEDDLTFDPAAVYEESLADQLAAYLEVPYEVTEDHWPRWKLTADVAADPRHVESLPFLANDLATVCVPTTEPEPSVRAEPDPITSFLRSDGGAARSSSDSVDPTSNIVKPRETDAIEHAWIADGFPLGASKTDASYYRRRLDRPVQESGSIAIDIVCNDDEMADEDVVEEFYGARDFFQFDIDVHYGLSVAELRELLSGETDFFHYIGHVEDGGFQCSDGLLDARTLESTGVEAFLLNACRSYIQGEALVERGSLGGIVTLSNISNDPAVRVGRALARALNMGFSLQAGLSVARNVTLFGKQYITIGDGSIQLLQANSGTPILAELEQHSEGYDLSIYGFPTSRTSIGSMFTPHVAENTMRYLNSGHIDSFTLTADELREFFNLGLMPVLFEDELTWSDNLLENEFG